MPELPEVEAFKSYIKSHCMHKTIEDVTSTDTRVIKGISFSTFKKDLIKSQFDSIERRGKYLVIDLKPSHKKLIMHFGLTGFIVVTEQDKKVRFETVDFIFKEQLKLAWCSVRKFERLWLVDGIDKLPSLKDLGPDALQLSKQQFQALMESSKRKNIKTFLMDQSLISGIGNEYSDEILFQAGIDPHHQIEDLSNEKIHKIYLEMHKILKYAMAVRKKHIKQLSQTRMFSADDSKVFKPSYLQAHRHSDMLCPKNSAHKLKKVTIGGRSSYYCPIDQK